MRKKIEEMIQESLGMKNRDDQFSKAVDAWRLSITYKMKDLEDKAERIMDGNIN